MVRGQMSLNWDAINHHIYLGWVAERPRFENDFWAAGSQSYQYPYLYWPIYRLYMSSLDGRWVGMVWCGLHTLALPALHLIARIALPGQTWYDVVMRFLAVLLSLSSAVLVAYTGVSSNDVLAAIPLLWAIALSLKASTVQPAALTATALLRMCCTAGALAGVSTAFKLSNGPMAIVLPVFWMWAPASVWTQRLSRTVWAGLFTIFFCLLAYLPWGWQLWHYFGNPTYPFFPEFGAFLRKIFNWVAP